MSEGNQAIPDAEKIARIQKDMLSTFDRSQAISQPNPDDKYRYQ
ncbi:hypothetical protein [Klebsiella oxytoca]|jgi:hypothetical protein|nr:hypothetical protein [Klebsiella oxytoca]MCW9445350.1 hypothetical protein [Klebsiella oxytoca]MCW9522783.1 hypothetical protein [Klebsiella oxytoca]MCW9534620.1 hypothetical protein [Klebsiella oxytoca]MCW9593984.1 hypothetical protein [Klebsiella oxytoca]MCW9605691.1 hypothetical protein [Klebsiella oxytoca]